MLDGITIHPQSIIGKLTTKIETLSPRAQGLQANLTALIAERETLQARVDKATLRDDALQLAAAQIRIGLLDKAITAARGELEPVKHEIQQATSQRNGFEADYSQFGQSLQRLMVLLGDDTIGLGVHRWYELLQQLRDQMQALVEAPGIKYTLRIAITFESSASQARPTVLPSAHAEQARVA